MRFFKTFEKLYSMETVFQGRCHSFKLSHASVFVWKRTVLFSVFKTESTIIFCVFESFDWKRYRLSWEHAHLLVSNSVMWSFSKKTPVFIHPHEYKTKFSKISALERVFKRRVFGDRFYRTGVAGRPDRRKNLRLETNSEKCWRGLNYLKRF